MTRPGPTNEARLTYSEVPLSESRQAHEFMSFMEFIAKHS